MGWTEAAIDEKDHGLPPRRSCAFTPPSAVSASYADLVNPGVPLSTSFQGQQDFRAFHAPAFGVF